ncbi:MAG TPA: STAS domain-containing protein [Acidimicrobiia bacterium]
MGESRDLPDARRSDVEARVVVTGEIDMATAPTLSRDLQAAIREHPARVLVDLSGVAFLDSSGINALVRAQHLVDGFGVDLVLESPNEACQRVLKVAGLDTLFHVRP